MESDLESPMELPGIYDDVLDDVLFGRGNPGGRDALMARRG
jgi:hypothetical protein